MADPPAYRDSNVNPRDDTNGRDGRGSTTGAPRWVKVSGIIVGVLVLVFLVLFTGIGGEHGPGRHMPGNNAPADAPAEAPVVVPAEVDGGGHAPPAGGHG